MHISTFKTLPVGALFRHLPENAGRYGQGLFIKTADLEEARVAVVIVPSDQVRAGDYTGWDAANLVEVVEVAGRE